MNHEDDDFDLQLALALSQSLQTGHSSKEPAILSEQAAAFLTDAPLSILREQSKNDEKESRNTLKLVPNSVRTSGFQNTINTQSSSKTSQYIDPDAMREAPAKTDDSMFTNAVPVSKNRNGNSGGDKISSSSSSKLSPVASLSKARADRDIEASKQSQGSSILEALGAKVCAACKSSIVYGRYITIPGNGNYCYHPQCFRCNGCGEAIEGSFVPKGDPPTIYHNHCAIELFNPRCSVCSCSINGRFFRHPFFESEAYCTTHDGVASCFACNRKEPIKASGKESFSILPDGRSICPECSSTVIMDSAEAKAIFLKIVDFMQFSLGLSIPKEMREVPVLCVDIQSLNEHRDDNLHAKAGHSAGGGINNGSTNNTGSSSTVRGMTLSTQKEVRYFSPGAQYYDAFHRKYIATGLPFSVLKVEEIRSVTCVLVLYGLPADLTSSILAHEAMHVWLKLNRRFPFSLNSKIEEGLCQVISDKYLELSSSSRLMGNSDSLSDTEFAALQKEETLRGFLRYQIMADPSEIYGNGFREVYKCIKTLDLQTVLDHIEHTRDIPHL
jgi:hypothetical protein